MLSLCVDNIFKNEDSFKEIINLNLNLLFDFNNGIIKIIENTFVYINEILKYNILYVDYLKKYFNLNEKINDQLNYKLFILLTDFILKEITLNYNFRFNENNLNKLIEKCPNINISELTIEDLKIKNLYFKNLTIYTLILKNTSIENLIINKLTLLTLKDNSFINKNHNVLNINNANNINLVNNDSIEDININNDMKELSINNVKNLSTIKITSKNKIKNIKIITDNMHEDDIKKIRQQLIGYQQINLLSYFKIL